MEINEFYEKYKNEKQIDHVMDFLKFEYSNKKIMFNYEEALRKTQIWVDKLNKKTNGLNAGRTEFVLDLDDGFSLVRLIDLLFFLQLLRKNVKLIKFN